MKLDSRRILAASILTFVLLFIFTMLFDWRFNYAEFPRDVVLGLLVLACVVLAFLTAPGRGLFQAALRLIALSRNMWDHRYGARPLQPGETSGAESTKAHRKFASTVGGHVAGLIGNLKQLVGHGASGQPRLQVARASA